MSAVPQLHAPELDALVRRLNRAMDEGVSQKAMRLIGADLVRSTRKRITSTKSDPDGTPWVAWSDDYEARKKPGTMLRQSRALERSIVGVVSGDTIEVGSADIKSAVHQFGHTIAGGPFAGKHIPARPYLGLSDEDESSIHDRIIDDVRRRFAS